MPKLSAEFSVFHCHHSLFQLSRNSFDTHQMGLQILYNKYWTLFSNKAPKGFGKFFGERSSKPPKTQDETPTEKPQENPVKRPREAPSTSKKEGFEFKFDFGSGNRGSDGKQSGGKGTPDREKWFTIGMIGSALAIAAFSYYGYAYQEISWKDLTK